MAKDIPVEAEIYLRLFEAYSRGHVVERDDQLIADFKRDALETTIENSRARNEELRTGPNHKVEKRIKGPGIPPEHRRRT
jgi:hypothetical protein